MMFLKGHKLILRDGLIAHVFYPVFSPNKNAEEVIAWLSAR
jgi:peroxiredoxin